MPVISIKSFGGISPRTPPRYLQPGQAQAAINCPVFTGPLTPLTDVSASVHSLTKAGEANTIFRYGDSGDQADDEFWFHWSGDIDVARGQIFDNEFDWVFYSGDGALKATHSGIAISGSDYPTNSIPLGLPAPTAVPTAVADYYSPTAYPASVKLLTTLISQVSSTYGISISITTDEVGSYTNIATADPITAGSIATAINASGLSGDITATANDDDTVTVVTDLSGTGNVLFVQVQTGIVSDPGPFAFNANPNTDVTGAADTDAYLNINANFVTGSSYGNVLTMRTESGEFMSKTYTASPSLAALAADITTAASGGEVTAAVDGNMVVVSAGTEGLGPDGYIRATIREWTQEWVEDPFSYEG